MSPPNSITPTPFYYGALREYPIHYHNCATVAAKLGLVTDLQMDGFLAYFETAADRDAFKTLCVEEAKRLQLG